jgi:hypothetical protein
MRRIVACIVLLLVLAGGLWVPALPWWGLAALMAAAAVLAWKLSSCPHRGPLALLPATAGLDGAMRPPRWYCDACGLEWEAHFEKAQTPVRKFTGYDESKAVHAAKRAAELADRQRTLALQRAGLRPAARKVKTARPPALSTDAADVVVPIRQGRRLAG